MQRRTYAIGDIHGCYQETVDLLKLIDPQPTDRLVFLGDFVDRGPQPKEVVDLVRSLTESPDRDVWVIMGNHDEKAYRWLHREEQARLAGKRNTMSPPEESRRLEWESLGEVNQNWLSSLPAIVQPHPEWFAVHAGLEDVPLAQQRFDKLMRTRFLDPQTGKMKPFDNGSLAQPTGSVHWMEMWKGPENVVYGHSVHSLTDPRVDRVGDVECWGIDTGCVFGGRLTALCLETKEVFQVQAREEYSSPLFLE